MPGASLIRRGVAVIGGGLPELAEAISSRYAESVYVRWAISGHADKSAPCPLYPPSRRWLNTPFRVVLDAVDRAVDRVGLHQSRILGLPTGVRRGFSFPSDPFAGLLTQKLGTDKHCPRERARQGTPPSRMRL